MDKRKTLEERVAFLEGKLTELLTLLFHQDNINQKVIRRISRLEDSASRHNRS